MSMSDEDRGQLEVSNFPEIKTTFLMGFIVPNDASLAATKKKAM